VKKSKEKIPMEIDERKARYEYTYGYVSVESCRGVKKAPTRRNGSQCKMLMPIDPISYPYRDIRHILENSRQVNIDLPDASWRFGPAYTNVTHASAFPSEQELPIWKSGDTFNNMNQHFGDISGLFGMLNFLDDKSATIRENRRLRYNLSFRQFFCFSATAPSGVTNPRPSGVCILIRRCVQDLTYPSGRAHLSLLSYSGGKILRLAAPHPFEQPAPRPSCICSASASRRSIPAAVECFWTFAMPCGNW
jgi:hypothetical protein